MNGPNQQRLRYAVAFLIILVVLFAACAEIVAPPGGPEDKQGPYLLSSMPQNGALNVPGGNTITLYFSERIVKPRLGRAVFVSPRSAVAPELKFKSDYIVLVLPDSFAANQTYVVTVSNAVTDLRNNKIDTGVTVAFSTGDVIDSGRVAGYLYREGGQAAESGALVGLYYPSQLADGVPYDSVYPEYVTTSNTKGYFSLDYLPDSTFRLIAFEDANRNGRFNPPAEKFAVPDRPIVVGGSLPLTDLQMTMTSADTSRPAIVSAGYTADKLVRIRFSQEIGLDYLSGNPSGIEMIPSDDSLGRIPARAFQESDESGATELIAWCGELADGTYKVSVTYDTTHAPITYDAMTVVALEDKVAPKIVRWMPGEKPVLPGEVNMSLVFSEPLDTSKITDQTFMLWTSDGREVPVGTRWSDVFHMALAPESLLVPGNYRLAVTEFDIIDRAGNLFGDSLTEYPIKVLDVDSMGSISGNIVVDLPEDTGVPAVLSFKSITGRSDLTKTAEGNQFKVEVPAGKYLLSGFLDRNGNGVRDEGSLFPFTLSETEASYPDTISVRARFETAGIEFLFK